MTSLSQLMQSILLELKFKIDNLDGSVKREFDFPNIPNKIRVAIGARRTGKTYFCLQKIKKYLESGVPINRILYLNCEDDRLLPFTQEKFTDLIESFYTLYPQNHDQLCYLFFDEIQNVENWPIVIRRIFDSKPVEIFLTGSSAKLLSKEIATSLRGRSIATEVWPFSFKEYLSAHKVESFDLPLAKKNSDTLFKYFKDYLEIGGFPEIIHSNISSDQRRQILQEYVDVVIFRDIIERYGITNVTLIKYLIKTLINNVSTLFSVNKFYNDLKSQGYHISKNTIHEYMTYIEDAFLIFNVPLYSESLRKTQISSKKIYAVDPALYAAYAMRIRNQELSSNAGHIFENFIYLTLRRAKQEVYYYVTQSGLEIDFLTISPDRTLSLYQVMWNSEDPKTLQREQRALAEAKEELGVEGQLITPESFLSIDSPGLTF